MRKVGITSAKVHVELDYYLKGSVKQGTVENKVTEVRSDFTVESKDPDSDVLEIIRIAKQGCFAENLVKNGAKEITLLGQNVNAYSYMNNSKEYRLSSLINHLEKYSELKRIRYTTSHPRDMSEDLLDCYSNCKKLFSSSICYRFARI